MSVVTTDILDGVALVTLNRPQQMNALSADVRLGLVQTFSALNENPDVRVAILTGAGERAFCAGLDLKELGAGGVHPQTIVADVNDPVSTLNRFTKPIIGAINGVAITGGFELALACDVLLASSTARFADTHGRVGIMPGWGLSQKLSRLVGIARAKELSLTGNFLDAATANAWGLVNRVVAPGELLAQARALAADMAQMPLEILVTYKKLIDDGFALPFGEAMALEKATSGVYNAGVSAAEIEARRAGIQARGRSQ